MLCLDVRFSMWMSAPGTTDRSVMLVSWSFVLRFTWLVAGRFCSVLLYNSWFIILPGIEYVPVSSLKYRFKIHDFWFSCFNLVY